MIPNSNKSASRKTRPTRNTPQLNLSGTGMRMTSQRALILEIVRQGHFDADEVYRRAREKMPRISLSTVYRTLHNLKKRSLIEELHFDEEHHHYEVKPSTEHHHLTCLSCGRVIEFQYPLARLIKRNVTEARDFEITETELRMSGYCARCREKGK